jgi:cell wall-associated NlpC family hydrolase
MRPLTQKQIERAVQIAQKFVQASIDGKASVTVGQVTHVPTETGMCARFVREVIQAATGRPESDTAGVFGANANETAKLLRAAGFSVGDTSDLQPGDLVYRPAGKPGHIAMYIGTGVPGHIGEDIFAENTSAGNRGIPRRPGTKYTPRGPISQGGFGTWKEVFRLTKAVV